MLSFSRDSANVKDLYSCEPFEGEKVKRQTWLGFMIRFESFDRYYGEGGGMNIFSNEMVFFIF